MMHNSFVHRVDGKIFINGIEVPLDVLKTYDPTYTLPEGIKSRKYTVDPSNGTGHHFVYDGLRQIKAEHPWSAGDKYIANLVQILAIKQLLDEDSADIQDMLNGVTCNHATKRVSEYPPIAALTVALWELVVEGNDRMANELQAARLHIKDKYPKTSHSEKETQ